MAASMASCQACRVCFARALQRVHNTRLIHTGSSRCQHSAQSSANTQHDPIIIPKRKQKDEYAVLRALGNTVAKDPTAHAYIYHDDPYLAPRNLRDKRLFKKTAESGRKAAQYVLQKYPKLFTAHQHDEPKIEAFYPPSPEYVFKEPGEDAIMERVQDNDIKAAWQMYKETTEKGLKVSLQTCNVLLDLLCFHGNKWTPSLVEQIDQSISAAQQLQAAMKNAEQESNEEDPIEEEAVESTEASKDAGKEEQVKPLPKWMQFEVTWIDGNEAEQLFEAMEEKDAHSYNSMLQGMGKHNAHAKAFTVYNDMQQKGLQADVRSYNALIDATVFIRDSAVDRWNILVQLMKQMELEGVRPTLYTFNSILMVLSRSREVGRMYGMQTLAEMKAVGIEPSLASYMLLIRTYQDNRNPVVQANLLYDIMDDIEGKEITLRHPLDVQFFVSAMDVCVKCKDLELAYRVDTIVNTGNNVLLLGVENFQNMYYSRLFMLITQMENADAMLEYYDKLVPSAIIPNSDTYVNMLQCLESAGAYDKIMSLWKDAVSYGYIYDNNVVDTVLTAMAMATDTDKQLQEEFCHTVTSIMKSTKQQEPNQARGRARPRPVRPRRVISLTADKLNNMVMVYLKGQQMDKAWETLQYCMKTNKVPSTMVMEDFLAACISSGDKEMALGCVQVAVHFWIGPSTMAERIKEEMLLTPQDRKHLDYILQDQKSKPRAQGDQGDDINENWN